MAYSRLSPFDVTAFPAAADLSGSQYCAVVLNSSGQIALAGANARAFGILQDKPKAAGEFATVAKQGETKALAGGNFSVGDALMVNGSGQLIAATTGNPIVAYAESAGASGRYVTVIFGKSFGLMP